MKLLPSTNVLTFDEARRALDQIVDHYNRVHETYGMIYLSGSTPTQVINNAATKITAFNTEVSSGIEASHANDKLTILNSGRYEIQAHLSIAAQSSSANVSLQIYKNGSIFVSAGCKATVGTNVFVDLVPFSIGDLEKDDYIELYALGGGGLTFDVAACSLVAKRLA